MSFITGSFQSLTTTFENERSSNPRFHKTSASSCRCITSESRCTYSPRAYLHPGKLVSPVVFPSRCTTTESSKTLCSHCIALEPTCGIFFSEICVVRSGDEARRFQNFASPDGWNGRNDNLSLLLRTPETLIKRIVLVNLRSPLAGELRW